MWKKSKKRLTKCLVNNIQRSSKYTKLYALKMGSNYKPNMETIKHIESGFIPRNNIETTKHIEHETIESGAIHSIK